MPVASFGKLAAITCTSDGLAISPALRASGTMTAIFQTDVTSSFWDLPTITFIDTGLDPGSTHTYRVQVLDKSGASLGVIPTPRGVISVAFAGRNKKTLFVVGSVGSTAADFDTAVRTISSLDLRTFFETILPLSDFANAWELARSRKHLKIVLRVDESLGDVEQHRTDEEPAAIAAGA